MSVTVFRFDSAHDPVPKIIKQILTHAIELVVPTFVERARTAPMKRKTPHPSSPTNMQGITELKIKKQKKKSKTKKKPTLLAKPKFSTSVSRAHIHTTYCEFGLLPSIPCI